MATISRTGAIARFSPVMAEITRMAGGGRPVLGICNGFQILCEAGLLPGALIANRDLAFICRFVELEVVDTATILTDAAELGQRIRIPLNSYEGSWVDPTDSGRVALQVSRRPQRVAATGRGGGELRGNVVGVMPHPERATDELLGSVDGQVLLEGFLDSWSGCDLDHVSRYIAGSA